MSSRFKKVTQEEKERRKKYGLCFYYGQLGHIGTAYVTCSTDKKSKNSHYFISIPTPVPVYASVAAVPVTPAVSQEP